MIYIKRKLLPIDLKDKRNNPFIQQIISDARKDLYKKCHLTETEFVKRKLHCTLKLNKRGDATILKLRLGDVNIEKEKEIVKT